VPPGVDTGTKLKVSGEGEPGENGGAPGNLIVLIQMLPHDVFLRDGQNLICELPITLAAAVSGGIVDVPTVSGRTRMKIAPGTQNGTTLRIRGKGMPALKGGQRGDQLVKIMVEIPSSLSGKQEELLDAFVKSLTEKNEPVQQEFQRKASRFMHS